MSELGSIRFKDQFQMLIPKSDFCNRPHTAPLLHSTKQRHQKSPFWNCVWNSDCENSKAYTTSSVYQLSMLRNTWGNYFIVLPLKTLDVCSPHVLLDSFSAVSEALWWAEPIRHTGFRLDAWCWSALTSSRAKLESHTFFPNSDLLAHCQSGHARAASQQKHIGKINLS